MSLMWKFNKYDNKAYITILQRERNLSEQTSGKFDTPFCSFLFKKLIGQVDNRFSGCYDILHYENDTKHCLVICNIHFVQRIQL